MIKKISLIILVSIAFLFLFLVISKDNTNECSVENKENNTIIERNGIKVGASWDVPFIYINNDNWSATELPWIQNRTGNLNDPHIIENVTIDANGSPWGILIQNSNDHFIIRNCSVFNSGSGTWSAAIKLNNINNGMLINNTVFSNTRSGILLENNCVNNTILKNIVRNNGFGGILLRNSNNNSVLNNTAYKNSRGIYILYSENSTVSGNIAYQNNEGIILWDGDNSIISENSMSYNVLGLLLRDYSDNNKILDNNIFNNTLDGIVLFDSDNKNTISGNSVINNTDKGIRIVSISKNNKIYNNMFIGNGINAVDYGGNTWNSNNIGNYWDDYIGFDADDNGIGDSPYTFSVGVDNLPIYEDGDDEAPPIINVDLPIMNQYCGSIAPNFQISINGLYLNSTWYNIEGFSINYTFTGFVGQINQDLWDDVENGTVLIRFYANDSLGNEASDIVIVNKSNPFFEAQDIILINPLNQSYLYTGWVNFTWLSLDAPFGVVNYTIQISNFSDFTMLVLEGNNIGETVGISNFTFYVNFDTNQYYWRVRPTYYEFIGNWSDFLLFNLTYTEFEPHLSYGAVNPKMGDQYTKFNFTVIYTDLDNNAPVFINATINGTSYKMDKVNSLDVNYVDGCMYQFLLYLSPEDFNYSYFFICSDGKFSNFTTIFIDLEVKPANYYEPYLLTPRVTPTLGNYSTVFNFTVWYYDDDNNLPGYMNITINSTLYVMVQANAFDDDATDGILFYFATTLDLGDYHFLINCSDGKFTNSTERITGPQVNPFYGAQDIVLISPLNQSYLYTSWVNFTWLSLDAPFGIVNYTIQISNFSDFSMLVIEANNVIETVDISNFTFYVNFDTNQYYWRVKPTYYKFTGNWSDYFTFNLTYTEYEPYLSYGAVNPKTGDQYTEFNFTVIYADLDNNAPAYINITINGTSFKMDKVNSLDVNYVDGCMYQYLIYLSPEDFNYSYFFICSDGKYSNFTAIFIDLEVNPANYFEPYLLNPDVSPKLGNSTLIFNFTVWYYDDDNNLPIFVNITINSSTNPMVKVDPLDIDTTNGILYYFTTTLDYGYYYFQINCSDGLYVNSTGLVNGPEVNPFVDEDKIILFSPDYLSILISGWINFTWNSLDASFGAVNYTLQISNQSDFSSLIFEAQKIVEKPSISNITIFISFSTGQYYWRVRPTFRNLVGNWSNYFIFNLGSNNFAPQLSLGQYTPSGGNQDTQFTFTVTYQDQDNNAPFFVNVRINGVAYTMFKINQTDSYYIDGSSYQCLTYLSPGTYVYFFECSDLKYYSKTSVFIGPSVLERGELIIIEEADDSKVYKEDMSDPVIFWAINTIIIAGIVLPSIYSTEVIIKRMKSKKH